MVGILLLIYISSTWIVETFIPSMKPFRLPTFLALGVVGLGVYFIRASTEIKRIATNRIQAERHRIQALQVSHETVARSKQSAIETEAVALTTNLITLHDSAPNQIQTLGRFLSAAESDLATADRDFADGAFAPFWDSIERAANNLSRFDQTTHQLASQVNQYSNSLRDREHTFPHFPVDLPSLPDPTHATDRMRAIVRKAQCNFQFATIYEQRKTNNILKHGFMSLSAAISELGDTVRNSIDELRESVSADIAASVKQQIATRESIDSAAAAARADSEAMHAEVRRGNDADAKRAVRQHEHEEKTEKMLDNMQRRNK